MASAPMTAAGIIASVTQPQLFTSSDKTPPQKTAPKFRPDRTAKAAQTRVPVEWLQRERMQAALSK
jgi:hypothetical protein